MTTAERYTTATEKRKEAYRTADRYGKTSIIYSLAGPRNISTRQAILEELTGTKPARAKAGIHAIETELNKVTEL